MRTSVWNAGWLISALVGLLLVGGDATAQRKQVTVHPKSQFWIQGAATTHEFTCVVTRVKGMGRLPAAQDTPTSTEEQQTEVLVRVPVSAFECGNRRMTRDLQETLEVEEYPEIRFELVHASVGEPLDASTKWRVIEALGTLTIAGTKRLIRLQAVGRAFDEHHFRVRGCKPIRMTYFGIEPPTKAFGLIRVKNRVEVQFDLLAQVEGESGRPFQGLSLGEPPSCEG